MRSVLEDRDVEGLLSAEGLVSGSGNVTMAVEIRMVRLECSQGYTYKV